MGIGPGATEMRVITPGQQTLTCTPKAVEGLLEEGVLAEGGVSPLKRLQR